MAAGREARPTLGDKVSLAGDILSHTFGEVVEHTLRLTGPLAAYAQRVSALQSIFPIDHAVAIFSFVPAGGSVRRRNHCRKAVRKLSEAMGVFLTAEGDGRAVLLADFWGRRIVQD